MSSRVKHPDPDFPAYVTVMEWHGFHASIMEWNHHQERYEPTWRGPKRPKGEAGEEAGRIAKEEGLEIR